MTHDSSFDARQCETVAPGGGRLVLSGECFPSFDRSDDLDGRGGSGAPDNADSLLGLYKFHGPEFVANLNGLFSGLVIDPKRKIVLLFNDRYGMERIYVHQKDGATFFASEAKALLSVLPELRAFDEQGVAQFLNYGCTLNGRTLFRNIEVLPGGSLWRFGSDGSCIKQQYFQPKQWEAQSPLTAEAFETEFAHTFKAVLPRYLSSEQPMGISITGGLDTRMIMACMRETGVRPVCYTYAGPKGDTLDVQLGRRVAQVCGLEHQTLRIGRDFLANYGHYVDRTVFVSDGCAGALGAHELYLSGLARTVSPVRLTGNYGSEVLRSVSTFKPQQLASALIDADFARLVEAQTASGADVHPVTHAAFREIPWHLFGTLAAGRSQLTFRTPYLDNDIVALAYRAPAASRQSPRAALRLIDGANPVLGRIPTDRGVAWHDPWPLGAFRRAYAEATFKLDYFHELGLPDCLSRFEALFQPLEALGLLGLHKYLPYRVWFKRDLAGYAMEVLSDAATQRMPYWNSCFLPSMIKDHVAGRRNCVREIGTVLTLEAVNRTLINGMAHSTATRAVV